jgi:hypothetical protein
MSEWKVCLNQDSQDERINRMLAFNQETVIGDKE